MPIPKSLLKEAIVAEPGFNRWRVPPASIAIHLCIGSVYAWSIFESRLTREFGFFEPAADDWSKATVGWIFSCAIVFLGLAAAVAGRWLEKVGPRCVGVTAAILWGGGFIVGGLGIMLHNIWLLYLGYGVLGGCGLGLGYVSPVSTLIRWFPDRRGMATGLAIMGFGGGAMIGAPMKEWLIGKYSTPPTRLGSESELVVTTENGRRYTDVSGERHEVKTLTAEAIAANKITGLTPGVYAVGSGNTGTAPTFFTLGGIYFVVMMGAAFAYRVPAENWKPDGWEPPAADKAHAMITRESVSISSAVRTPQFWLLWIVLCFNVTAGIGVLGVAKTMIKEIFSTSSGFAATYVLMISVFNMVGRFFWASISDWIGRKTTYAIFFLLGCLLYLSIPFVASNADASAGATWLVIFYAATMIIFTMYGGGFATIPAYLADLFGSKYVGAIHGRLLTAWSVAGVAGPTVINWLRQLSYNKAIAGLSEKVDPAAFQEKFGSPISKIGELAAANTVNIQSLLEIAPPGTTDPTSGLYNTTMYAMAGLLVIGFIANAFVRPVHHSHHIDP